MHFKQKIKMVFMAILAVGALSISTVLASSETDFSNIFGDVDPKEKISFAIQAFKKHGTIFRENGDFPNGFIVLAQTLMTKDLQLGLQVMSLNNADPTECQTAIENLRAYILEHEETSIATLATLTPEKQLIACKFFNQGLLEPQEVIRIVWRHNAGNLDQYNVFSNYLELQTLTPRTIDQNDLSYIIINGVTAIEHILTGTTTIRGKTTAQKAINHLNTILRKNSNTLNVLYQERKYAKIMKALRNVILNTNYSTSADEMSVPYNQLFGAINNRKDAIVERAFIHNVLSDIKEKAKEHMKKMIEISRTTDPESTDPADQTKMLKASLTAQYLGNFTNFITGAIDALTVFIDYVDDPEAENPKAAAAINGYTNYIRHQEAFNNFRHLFQNINGGDNFMEIDKALRDFFASEVDSAIAEAGDVSTDTTATDSSSS